MSQVKRRIASEASLSVIAELIAVTAMDVQHDWISQRLP